MKDPNFQKQYINGEWVPSSSAAMIDVEDPVAMAPCARIPRGDVRDAERAVEAAAAAFPGWSKTPAVNRFRLMQRVVDFMKENCTRVAGIETRELGAPWSYALKKHCLYQLSRIETYLRLADRVLQPRRTEGARLVLEPHGVVSCITPWNYPLGQIIQKVVPAILMGNTVVLKPSTLAPLSACVLAEAFHEAGFPKGVFNLVNGCGGVLGETLVKHPKVAMVSFTGSTEVGRRINRDAAEGFKRVCLELGGKSPDIWLPGMPGYEPACRKLFDSVFLNAGQTCTSLTRLFIHESMQAEVRALFAKILPLYPVGRPDDPQAVLGPVVSGAHYRRVADYIRSGVEEGAELFAGRVPGEPTDGYFIEPTIFMNVKPEMRIAREEIFGPVLSVLTYRTVEEAVRMANDTPYGLSSALYGPKEEVLKLAGEIHAGNVFLNDAGRDITAPMGGFKESGIGCESGKAGLMQFVGIKSVFDATSF